MLLPLQPETLNSGEGGLYVSWGRRATYARREAPAERQNENSRNEAWTSMKTKDRAKFSEHRCWKRIALFDLE